MSAIVPTSQITAELYAVNSLFVNYFVYRTGSFSMCFDTGLGLGNTCRELEKISVDPDRVSHIFLTHSDDDHVGGINYFKNARVYLSALEEPVAQGKVRRFPFKKNSLHGRDYTTLDDREVVRAGEVDVMSLSTPGHTIGSNSYLVNGSVLFTGDTVSLKNGKANPSPWFLNSDTRRLKFALAMIARMKNVSLLCTCHTGITRDFTNAMNGWDLKIEHLPDSEVGRKMDSMIIELLSACFIFEPKFKTQRFFNEMPSHRWIIRDGKKLAAHLATHQKQFTIDGRRYSFCGVAEVGVRPEYRGRGLVGKLLGAAEDFHKGMDFSILLGADHVYGRYGYEKVGNVYFPDESDMPNDHAMVKCLSNPLWPTDHAAIRGKYF